MSSTFENAKKGGFVIKPKGYEDGQTYLAMTAEVRTLGEVPVEWGDPLSIRSRVNDYFEIMKKYDCRPTVTGLAMAFGTRRQRLAEFRRGTYRKGGKYKDLTPEGIEEINKAYDMLDVLFESYMLHDDINPMLAMFYATNNFDYRNTSSIDINTPALDADGTPSAEEIRKKYGALPANTPKAIDSGEDKNNE